MSATASTLPKRKPAAKRRSSKKQSSGWLGWWPLILGIAVTPFAVKAATLLALAGPDGLRLLYPWMLLPKLHLLGLSDSLGNDVSQTMMYLQFPLYGLVAALVRRSKSAVAAVVQVSLIHLLAVGSLLIAGRG